jgi:anaerobic selenocysteine-containing dehydrogenase
VRWPCNDRHPRGCERLYEDLNFGTDIDYCETYGADLLSGAPNTRADYEPIDPKGKAFLRPVQWRRQPNPVSDAYPFKLITGRVVYHFHTRTKTARSEALNSRVPHPYVEIHPRDAVRLEIGLGDMVEINSPHGRWKAWRWWLIPCGQARCSCRSTTDAAQHTWYARDPISHQPRGRHPGWPRHRSTSRRGTSPTVKVSM